MKPPDTDWVPTFHAERERDLVAFRRWFDALFQQDDRYGHNVGVMRQAWMAALAWDRDRLSPHEPSELERALEASIEQIKESRS